MKESRISVGRISGASFFLDARQRNERFSEFSWKWGAERMIREKEERREGKIHKHNSPESQRRFRSHTHTSWTGKWSSRRSLHMSVCVLRISAPNLHTRAKHGKCSLLLCIQHHHKQQQEKHQSTTGKGDVERTTTNYEEQRVCVRDGSKKDCSSRRREEGGGVSERKSVWGSDSVVTRQHNQSEYKREKNWREE